MRCHDAYIAGLLAKAAVDSGSPLDGGTTVVPEADRAGTSSATSYPLPEHTIIWADPEVVDRLHVFNGPTLIESSEFRARAEALGGRLAGEGVNRVLENDALIAPVGVDAAGLSTRLLDGTAARDRSMLAALIDGCSADDVDEADLDLDDLDPHLLALVSADGAIAAFASARPSETAHDFDDIAVLTHPDFRRRRLGALAVHEFITHRRSRTDRFVYRCTVDNIGSNKLADSLGFTVVQRIAAVTFSR